MQYWARTDLRKDRENGAAATKNACWREGGNLGREVTDVKAGL
jgi:hypothetical protein